MQDLNLLPVMDTDQIVATKASGVDGDASANFPPAYVMVT